MATVTLYLLKDGTYADPSECSTDENGVLRHANGQEVAMRDDPRVPQSRSVDPDDEGVKAKRAKPKPETVKVPAPAAVKEAKPEVEPGAKPDAAAAGKDAAPEKPAKGYKTRGAKA
jgi:hypothetical protein